ncbi:uncharacterized protein (DUF1501 family) [Lewinella marina]|uniref:Secretion system C-terminal sorting domain-containing protein n=1 Tax=Neolewinella marina TaxID=438751 RepID=A0A2G0CE64_9BACT|nr:DUF1501 domain-containing protein [Neolewinella marina]NJB87423.1 uncharacterized protein (DUF1501 family) [Neolewinella marina]PHK98268.1 hypothetical protein CGL56_11225 [Neolewinella marina]
MKRRNFLQTAAALTIPAIMPLPGMKANSSRFTSLINPESDRILVIVHLFGGNDGLNTVIPLDQYDGITAVRPLLYLKESVTHKITDTVALHSSMAGMANMFKDGRLKIVQSAGYPNQNRSHFRSTDIWTTASKADEFLNTGWMGRYLDTQYPGYPAGFPSAAQPHPPAISIGNVAHPTCEGAQINFSQTVNDPLNTTELSGTMSDMMSNDRYGSELQFIQTTMQQTNDYNSVIKEAAAKGKNAVPYPGNSNPLAVQLQKVARMISGGLKTKVYTVYLGGFDLHAKQVEANTTIGAHADLLRQVSEAIDTFQRDMVAQKQDDRVMGMTFSEFGRRIRPNASFGTDHGTAGPMFLFGSCVNGGIMGDNVEVHKDVNQGAGVPMQFDFRDVYGSILVDWFDVPALSVKNMLHQDFKYLPLAGKCNETVTDNTDSTSEGWTFGEAFPNPASKDVYINVGSPDKNRLRYSLFDSRGRLVLANEIAVDGKSDHMLFSRPSRLPSGTYNLRLATETGGTVSRKVVFE